MSQISQNMYSKENAAAKQKIDSERHRRLRFLQRELVRATCSDHYSASRLTMLQDSIRKERDAIKESSSPMIPIVQETKVGLQALEPRIELQTPELLSEETDGDDLDDVTRIYVLNSLMQSNPERAMPLILDLLGSTASEKIKRECLTLIQSGDPQNALQLILDYASSVSDTAIQQEAILMLEDTKSPEMLQSLMKIYTNSSDEGVKRTIIHVFSASEADSLLFDIVKLEDVTALQIEAIQSLALMEQSTLLLQLYKHNVSRKIKFALIEALIATDCVDKLRAIYCEEVDGTIKTSLIECVCAADEVNDSVFLAFYSNLPKQFDKYSVIKTLVRMEKVQRLVELMHNEHDKTLKAEILKHLANMNTPDAAEFLFSLLENEPSKSSNAPLAKPTSTKPNIRLVAGNEKATG